MKPPSLRETCSAFTAATPKNAAGALKSFLKTKPASAATKKSSSPSRAKAPISRLKYESGVHRVQRVPVTEASGRIHTSTATVEVLAEVDEVEIHIPESDIKIDVYKSAGAGGQNVQKNSTAVRITHLPTGHRGGLPG